MFKVNPVVVLFISDVHSNVKIGDFIAAQYSPTNDTSDTKHIDVTMRVTDTPTNGHIDKLTGARIPVKISYASSSTLNAFDLLGQPGVFEYNAVFRRFVFNDSKLEHIYFNPNFGYHRLSNVNTNARHPITGKAIHSALFKHN